MVPTDNDALYTVVMQGIACRSIFGKDSGLYRNLTEKCVQFYSQIENYKTHMIALRHFYLRAAIEMELANTVNDKNNKCKTILPLY